MIVIRRMFVGIQPIGFELAQFRRVGKRLQALAGRLVLCFARAGQEQAMDDSKKGRPNQPERSFDGTYKCRPAMAIINRHKPS